MFEVINWLKLESWLEKETLRTVLWLLLGMDLSPPNVPFREKICLRIPLAPNPGHASELQGEFGMPSLTQQKMVKRCQEPLVETSSHKRGHQLHRPLSLKKQGQQPPQNLTASPATFENCSFPPVCRPWLQDVSALKHWPPWLSPVKALTQHSSTVHSDPMAMAMVRGQGLFSLLQWKKPKLSIQYQWWSGEVWPTFRNFEDLFHEFLKDWRFIKLLLFSMKPHLLGNFLVGSSRVEYLCKNE